MTIKELSILFDVSDETIRRAIKKANPDLLKHGVEARLTSAQVKSVFGHLWVKGGTSIIDDSNSHKSVGLPQSGEVNPHEMIRMHRQALDMIEMMIPKVETYDAICDSKNLKSVGEVAKIIGTGRNRLFEMLRVLGVIDSRNIPYQQYIEQGYFEVKDTAKQIGGESVTFPVTFFTGKGEVWISEKIRKSVKQIADGVGK